MRVDIRALQFVVRVKAAKPRALESKEETMKYLLALISEEGGMEDASPEEMKAVMDRWSAYGREAVDKGAFLAGEGLQPSATRLDREDRGGQGADGHRRPLRRVEGAARRLLPARVQGPRRGPRVREEDPAPERLGRGPSGDGLQRSSATRTRPRPAPRPPRHRDLFRSDRRPPVPARVGAGGREPDPGAGGLRRRRGGGAGGVRRRARALAERRRPGQSRAPG